MAKINTRILLRTDSLANWQSSTLVLNKGEVAIATLDGGKLAEVRVGTGGTCTWANALKLNVTADQISGLIETIEGTAKQYKVVANGENGNSWKLQVAALSGGDWTDVTGSSWTVDFTAVNTAIDALTANVQYLSGQIDATNATLNTVSSDYLTSADKNELTASIDTKLAKADFAALSVEIGLDAASASNKVATQNDIAALDGVMHFKGVVTAVPTATEGYEVGDVVLVSGSAVAEDNGKEFVLVNKGTEQDPQLSWEQIGDQAHYATKSYVDATVNAVSTEITGQIDTINTNIADITADVEYLSGQVDATNATLNTVSSDYLTSADKTELTTLVNTTSAETLVSANAYTDTKFADLSNYYTKTEVDAISTALSTDYSAKVKAVDDKLPQLSADAVAAANTYTDQQIDALSIDDYIKHGECTSDDLSGYFVFDCGGASLRENEPVAS